MAKAGGFFVPSPNLPTGRTSVWMTPRSARPASSGQMSRSVSPLQGGASSRMPYGTDLFLFSALLLLFDGVQEAEHPPAEQGHLHDIQGGVVIPVEDHAASWADVGAHAQAFLDN